MNCASGPAPNTDTGQDDSRGIAQNLSGYWTWPLNGEAQMAQTIFENPDIATTYTPDAPNGPKAVTKDPKLNPSPYKKGRVYSIYRHGFK